MAIPGFWTCVVSEPVLGWMVATPPLVVWGTAVAIGRGVAVADGRFWVVNGLGTEVAVLICEVGVGLVTVTTLGLLGRE